MQQAFRWTTADLDLLPDRMDGTRYEIISGELYVSRAPELNHQRVTGSVYSVLERWNAETQAGEGLFAPGLVFPRPQDDNVIPDLVLISGRRGVAPAPPRGPPSRPPPAPGRSLSPPPPRGRRA